MSNFAALIATIQANIKTNGNEEITGAVLQDVLEAMVQALGTEAINNLETALGNEVGNRQNADGTLQNNIDAEALRAGTAEGVLQTAINGIKSNIDNGYVYAGIATPSGTPASGKVFYIAVTAGTYTNYGALVVTQGINILKNNGTAWSQEQLIALDNTPTPSSSGLVKSGGVFEEIMTNGSAFDLTVHNSGTTYADLSAALIAMDSLPAAYKKGGMSIKFVQTSDNKYVQARLMAQTFTTDVTQWQGVDEEPILDSHNLLESKGAAIMEASVNYDRFLHDESISFSIDTITNNEYIPIPLKLKKGAYVISVDANNTYSVSVYNKLKSPFRQNITSKVRISVSGDTDYIYVKFEDANLATSATITFIMLEKAYTATPFTVEGLLQINESDLTNPKWASNYDLTHYMIPVNNGDVIRAKAIGGACKIWFLSADIPSPSNGDPIPFIYYESLFVSVESEYTVHSDAKFALVTAAKCDYFFVNEVNVIQDILKSIISRQMSRFVGVITPSTTISTPSKGTFCIGGEGVYSNIGNDMSVPNGYIGVFSYDSSWTLSTIKLTNEYDVPDVWKASLNNCISHVQTNNMLSAKNGDSFVFVTDSHFPNNKGNGVILASAVSKKTNNKMFVHGGDFVTKNKTKAEFFTILRNYADQLKVLYGDNWRTLFGNHDNNTQDASGDPANNTTKDDFYAIMYKWWENEVINPNKYLYYYWDNEAQNIRYVCFDFGVGGIGKEQVHWFASVAQSAPSNARIVVFNHGMWGSGSETFFGYNVDLADMCNAINTRSTHYTFDGATYDFSEITAKVSVVLCGHIHGYKYTYYGASQDYIGLPVIALEADQYNDAETSPVTLFTQKVHFIDLDFTQAKIHIFTLGYNINDSQGRDDKTPLDIVV